MESGILFETNSEQKDMVSRNSDQDNIVTMEQPTNTPKSVTPMPDNIANLLQQLPKDLWQGATDIYEAEHQHPNWIRTMIPLILHHLSRAQQVMTAQPPLNQGGETVIPPMKEILAVY